MRMLKLTPAILVVLGLLVSGASPAAAKITRVPELELKPETGFSRPAGVAVDQETGNVYVADSGSNVIDVFGKEGGGPAGGGPATITGFTFNGEPAGVAVDNACYFHGLTGKGKKEKEECKNLDPSNGDVYVTNSAGGAQGVDKLRLNSEHENAKHEVEPIYEIIQELSFSEPFGVAVDEQGDMYVVAYTTESIAEFNPKGEKVREITQSRIEHPSYVAVGTPGVIYIGGYLGEGGVVKLAVNAKNEGEIQPLNSKEGVPGVAVAVDSHGNAYIEGGGSVSEFNPSGELTGGFALDSGRQISGKGGLSVNDESGDIYVANLGYGLPVPEPEAITEPASNIKIRAATFNGTVNPEGEEIKYYYEYGHCSEPASCNSSPYPSKTPEGTLPAGKAETVPVPVEALGLEPASTYHVRLVATTAKNVTVKGSAVEFVTLPVIPGLTECVASGETSEDATLTASLDPLTEDFPVKYAFGYGTSEAPEKTPYPTKTPLATLVPEEEGEAFVKAMVTGLQPNTTYFCRLEAREKEGAEVFGPNGTFKTLPAAPDIESSSSEPGPAPRKTELLSGTINPENSPTTYHFAYIDQAGYVSGYARSVTAETNAGEGGKGGSIGPVQLNGLRAGTTYHYELVATNAQKETETGPDQTFTTAPATLPVVESTTVSGITPTTATVSSAIDQLELSTGYELDLATTVSCSGGGSCTGAQASYNGASIFGTLAPGQETIVVNLESLAPATTYHYRIVVTNEDGSEYGPDETFTTGGIPSALTQPLTPPLLATPNIVFPFEAKATGPSTKLVPKLEKALKACRKRHSRSKRKTCERQARKRYGGRAKR